MKFYILLLTMLFSFATHATVTKKGTLYTANFADQTLEDALIELSKKSNIKIEASNQIKLDQKITLGFENIEIKKIFDQLLGDYNFITLYQPNTNKIETVRILGTGQAVAQKGKSKGKSVNTPDEKGSVTLERKDNAFHMTVLINGQPVYMLVDTGATHLSISSDLAKKLNLIGETQVDVQTAGGKSSAHKVKIDSIVIAGKELVDIPAIILPKLKGDGLLGQNALKYFKQVTSGDTMTLTPIN